MTDTEPKRPTRIEKRERTNTILKGLEPALDELWERLEEQNVPQHWAERIHTAVSGTLRTEIDAYTEHEDCPNCGSDETEYHEPGFSLPNLMRCGQCGLQWQWEGIRQTAALNGRKK